MKPLAILAAFVAASSVATGQAQDLATIESKTAGMEQRDGYFPLWWDDDHGKVFLEVARLEDDFLYAVSLAAGLGSNDVGLDRGQLGPQRLVRFRRVGRRLLLVAPNLAYRATSDDPAERRAVEEAFAASVVFPFEVVARTGDRFLVDATPFVVRDAHGIAARLRAAGQGTFRLDAARSAPDPGFLKSFPRNTELEAILTFESESPGAYVRQVAADPAAVTLRVRHSLVELPPPGYSPREYDPRSGYFALSYTDYSAPVGEDPTRRFIARHRLRKKDPAQPVSDPVEPIVYYLDPGTPEPVRSALLEGGSWWADAFAAAGFSNAFRVEMLPDSADALDARFNMINWVHRATRGWSYGSTLTDPRTGEIIKGHVLLGSLRIRQDYLILEGILSPYANGLPEDDPMLAASLARIRQLSAHEIGHTIGLAHNYAASTNDRASVMDYPAPLVTLVDAALHVDSAYAAGIGNWDRIAVRYGYTQFADSIDTPAEERTALGTILDDANRRGLVFLTDQDARAPGSAHPLAHLWDNLSRPLDGLSLAVRVRRVALDRLGSASVRPGRPLATLQETLVPIYLYHRYQVEAVSRLLGGAAYTYAFAGQLQERPMRVRAAEQRRALDALLDALAPTELALPAGLRELLPPRPPGYGASRELFQGFADPMFDPYVPAHVAAELVVSLLLEPARAARLMYQADQDASLPSLSDVLAGAASRFFRPEPLRDDHLAEIERIVQQVWVDVLVSSLARSRLAPGVRARFRQHLVDLREWLAAHPGDDFETVAHRSFLFDEIDRYLVRLYDRSETLAGPDAPPGQPIGEDPGTSSGGDDPTGARTGADALERRAARRGWLSAWDERVLACAFDG